MKHTNAKTPVRLPLKTTRINGQEMEIGVQYPHLRRYPRLVLACLVRLARFFAKRLPDEVLIEYLARVAKRGKP